MFCVNHRNQSQYFVTLDDLRMVSVVTIIFLGLTDTDSLVMLPLVYKKK